MGIVLATHDYPTVQVIVVWTWKGAAMTTLLIGFDSAWTIKADTISTKASGVTDP